MSIDTERKQSSAAVAAPPVASLVRAELPSWSPWAVLVGAFVVVGVLLSATGGFSIAMLVVASAVVYAVATYVLSRVVEGGRKATDRLVTIVVTLAFLIALAPLVSVVITVVGNGLARFDGRARTPASRPRPGRRESR